MNEAIKSMGGEVVGINTETFDSNESAIEDAKKVLESQGATYRNLSIAYDSNAGKYASEIMVRLWARFNPWLMQTVQISK